MRLPHFSCLLLLAVLPALSQEPALPQPADPTQPDAALQKLLMTTGPNLNSAVKMPVVQMRGKIINEGGQGLVIIEVDKQIHALKKGSTLSLSGTYSHLSLQLTELNNEGATIEVLPLKQTLRLQ